MKTIFRYTNIGLLMAAILAIGAVAGFGQDPCTDTEGQKAADEKFRKAFEDKSIPGRRAAIEAGKQFLEKYGACEGTTKELSDYLKPQIPKMESALKKLEEDDCRKKLLDRFDKGLTAKNWDEVFVAGKEVLQKYPDEFRRAELVLGSIGLDETAKSPRVTKWNEDTLRFARQSIADLEAGKDFGKTFGVPPFVYKSKEDALGWMNYTIGYIYFFDKNDKKQGLSYLYKATQLASATKTNPVVFESIGGFYFDDVKKLAAEVDVLVKSQKDDDTPEVVKQKTDAIAAKIAMVNGTAEAAMDAYARAHSLADKTNKAYTDSLRKQLQTLYTIRFGNMNGFDAFIAKTLAKPMPNPLDPVAPISDPVAPTTTTTSTTPPVTTPATVKPTPPATTTTVKPAPAPATKPAAPAAKPVGGVKPQAVVKKPAVKRKGA